MELKYLDKVRITKGFYEGLEGVVTERSHMRHIGTRYYVEMEEMLNKCCIKIPKHWILENCLEKIEEVNNES